MEVRLSASPRATLVRQVVVQRERGFSQEPFDLGERWTLVSKAISLPAQVHCSYRYRRGGLFSHYPIILLAFGGLRALSIRVSSF